MMGTVLPTLAIQLMITPLDEKGDSTVGPNGGPAFLYRKDAHLRLLKEETEQLIKEYKEDSYGDSQVLQLVTSLETVYQSLADMEAKVAKVKGFGPLCRGN